MNLAPKLPPEAAVMLAAADMERDKVLRWLEAAIAVARGPDGSADYRLMLATVRDCIREGHHRTLGAQRSRA